MIGSFPLARHPDLELWGGTCELASLPISWLGSKMHQHQRASKEVKGYVEDD